MSRYTIQVSNHRDAGRRLATEEGEKSWKTIYDGPIASPKEAREAVDKMSSMYKHVRSFKGASVGKLWYAVLRGECA